MFPTAVIFFKIGSGLFEVFINDRLSLYGYATFFGCWCPTLMLEDRGCWRRKRLKPSPTSQSCHQHILSPTSVINIDVVYADIKFQRECLALLI